MALVQIQVSAMGMPLQIQLRCNVRHLKLPGFFFLVWRCTHAVHVFLEVLHSTLIVIDTNIEFLQFQLITGGLCLASALV